MDELSFEWDEQTSGTLPNMAWRRKRQSKSF